jgi:hypothetical protein
VLENWKLSGMQPDVVTGPAKRNPKLVRDWLHPVVWKEARQLEGGVNVVVNEPTDILTLLLHCKVATHRFQQLSRVRVRRGNLLIAKDAAY